MDTEKRGGDSESGNESGSERKMSEFVPAYMNAIIRRQFLQQMVKSFPENVQNRITVLKNIQLEHLKLEAQFFDEVYKLEKKYHDLYQPLYEKRNQIVNGAVEPPKEDAKWKPEPEDLDRADKNEEIAQLPKPKIPEDAKGIPDFWLTIFRNTEILSEMIQEHDEPALKKLMDIKIKYDDEHAYTLEFYFDKNEYFSNSVLTKKYYLKSIDEDFPFSYEGPEVYKCTGCVINWEKNMNLTIKTIRKKQKHKERGAVRTIVKQVPNDSFFNFFNPPQVNDENEEIDEESQGILATDFEIGHFLRSRIIPKAVLYYTGDIVDDDDDDDDDEFDGEEEDEDESDDEKTPKKSSKKASPNDCPNQ